MGKRPAARQASPMWVDTADLPTSDGHPFFERLNRAQASTPSSRDCARRSTRRGWAAGVYGRGRYFRLLFLGYFEGLRGTVRGVLRGADGPPESTAGAGISVCCSSAISKGCRPSAGLRGGWPIR